MSGQSWAFSLDEDLQEVSRPYQTKAAAINKGEEACVLHGRKRFWIVLINEDASSKEPRFLLKQECEPDPVLVSIWSLIP